MLLTERLRLRPFRLDDAACVQRLAGAREIADTTENVPHPYEDGMAEAWIASLAAARDAGDGVTYAIERREDTALIGAISLKLEQASGRLGYWIGTPYWNRGYATEAAIAVINAGFRELCLDSVRATHLTRNPASGRVMQKAGMRLEHTAKRATTKRGRLEDLAWYAILRDEWAG